MKKLIGVIIQARTSSTRLPMKVLLSLLYNGETTVLEQVIKRFKVLKLPDRAVATTTKLTNNKIANIATRTNVAVFRCYEEDVLSRYYHATREFSIDIIVRITNDCPYIDPNVISTIIGTHLNSDADYVLDTVGKRYS